MAVENGLDPHDVGPTRRHHPASTTGRPEQITVGRGTTPGAHRTDSDEIGWWLPIIGPTSTILAYW